MPTYDYLCEACQHQFEEFQSISAKVLKKCPKCGKPKLKRLIGPGAGVIFKGSGFYQTDYKKTSTPSTPPTPPPAPKESETKKSSKKKD